MFGTNSPKSFGHFGKLFFTSFKMPLIIPSNVSLTLFTFIAQVSAIFAQLLCSNEIIKGSALTYYSIMRYCSLSARDLEHSGQLMDRS